MANTLTGLTPQTAIRVMDFARENAVTPRLIATDYSQEVAQKGQVIKVNVQNDFTATAITAGNLLPTTNINDVNPTTTNITLDQWYGSRFVLSTKEAREIAETGMSQALESAIRAVVNNVDAAVFGNYIYVGNNVGTAGTTPFASNPDLLNDANVKLATGRTPLEDRAFVGDEFAYYNANNLSVFQDVDRSGLSESLRDARISRGLGYNWAMNQNVVTHDTSASGTYQVDAAGSIES